MNKTLLRSLAAALAVAAASCVVGAPGEPSDDSTEATPADPGGAGQEENVGTAASADLAGTVEVIVSTGKDDLRSSSTAFISLQRADGSWTKEYQISHGASAFSTFDVSLNTQSDNFDPCTLNVKLRLQQGSCFLCTSDNWDVASLKVILHSNDALIGTRTLVSTTGRLTESKPTLTVGAQPIPAGTICTSGNAEADCAGNLFDASVLAGPGVPFDQDSVCDDGTFGFDFLCEAFLWDSGACGQAPTWACPSGWYGGADTICDCRCGAWDPNCNNPSQNNASQFVNNCAAGQVCVNQQQSPGRFAAICMTPPGPVR